MLYMVVENFRGGDAAPVYRRLRDQDAVQDHRTRDAIAFTYRTGRGTLTEQMERARHAPGPCGWPP